MNEILGAIDANAHLLTQALWSNNVSVVAHFADNDGRRHTYNLDGSFLFRRPHFLRLDLRPGLGDQVMQIGSNADDYWIWVEPEVRTLWWGRYRNVGKPCARTIPIRPDQLAAALGLDGLPKPGDGLIGPARECGEALDILYYLRERPAGEAEWQPGGRYLLEPEYLIDRFPPYMIRGVQFHDEFGRVVTKASLDDYRLAWPDGPWVARKMRIEWPMKDGRFELAVGAYKAMPPDKVSPRAFERPTNDRLPRGIQEVVQVDAECDELEPATSPKPPAGLPPAGQQTEFPPAEPASPPAAPLSESPAPAAMPSLPWVTPTTESPPSWVPPAQPSNPPDWVTPRPR